MVTFRQAERQVLSTVLGDQAVLMLTDTGQFFELDDTGTAIWSILDSDRGLDEIVAALMAEFDVDQPTCAAQTQAFLADMVAKGLITRTPDEQPAT